MAYSVKSSVNTTVVTMDGQKRAAAQKIQKAVRKHLDLSSKDSSGLKHKASAAIGGKSGIVKILNDMAVAILELLRKNIVIGNDLLPNYKGLLLMKAASDNNCRLVEELRSFGVTIDKLEVHPRRFVLIRAAEHNNADLLKVFYTCGAINDTSKLTYNYELLSYAVAENNAAFIRQLRHLGVTGEGLPIDFERLILKVANFHRNPEVFKALDESGVTVDYEKFACKAKKTKIFEAVIFQNFELVQELKGYGVTGDILTPAEKKDLWVAAVNTNNVKMIEIVKDVFSVTGKE
jgi:hypothetical protein